MNIYIPIIIFIKLIIYFDLLIPYFHFPIFRDFLLN
jgi:hypothetical protein